MPIPIDPAEAAAATIPAAPEFVPDRVWVRSLTLAVETPTKIAVRATSVPGTATQLGDTRLNLPEVSSPDLLAELLAAPASQAKADSLAAFQRVMADIPVVFAFLRALRG